jgi:hypothetical protein
LNEVVLVLLIALLLGAAAALAWSGLAAMANMNCPSSKGQTGRV